MASETFLGQKFFSKTTQTHYRSQLPALTLQWSQAHNLQMSSCGYTEVCYGSFSERFKKIGRGFIKILETWQFGLSFNIIRHVFSVLTKIKFLSALWIFEKFWSCAKKNRKITLLAVNNAFLHRLSWLSTFFEGNLVNIRFLLHVLNFCKFSIFHGLFSAWPLTLETKLFGSCCLKINNRFHDFRNWFFRTIKMSWHAFWHKKCGAY
jgi:hypothetical protein